MSLYWAAGGQVGRETLGVEIGHLARARDAMFVAELWAAVVLKAAAAAALALVAPWGQRLPRRLRLIPGATTGGAITLYATTNRVPSCARP